MSIKENIASLRSMLPNGVKLVAVSKTHPVEMIREAYNAGERRFGENRPQEMQQKYQLLPKDIEWHMIGHLQTNKIKYIAPFVAMVESVDSARLAEALNQAALRSDRTINILLEVHIAREESKSGWSVEELQEWLHEGIWRNLTNIRIRGLMGVASLSDDSAAIGQEFDRLRSLFEKLREEYFGKEFDTLSMGMSDDYLTAIKCGSTEVRIGSLIFGRRDYSLKG